MKNKWTRLLLIGIAVASLTLSACGGEGGNNGGGDDDKIDIVLAPIAEITLDGDRSDWDNIEPLVVDKSGDGSSEFSGTDAKSLSMAMSPDRSTFYIMMDFHDGIPNPTFAAQNSYYIHFDKDTDGSEYLFTIGIRWDSDKGWYSSLMDMLEIQDTVALAVNEVIEISVPYTEIGSPKELFFKGGVSTSDDLWTTEMIPDFGEKYWPKVVFP